MHQVLPFQAMGEVVRGTLASGSFPVGGAAFALLGAWRLVSFVVTYRIPVATRVTPAPAGGSWLPQAGTRASGRPMLLAAGGVRAPRLVLLRNLRRSRVDLVRRLELVDDNFACHAFEAHLLFVHLVPGEEVGYGAALAHGIAQNDLTGAGDGADPGSDVDRLPEVVVAVTAATRRWRRRGGCPP